jgi:hypothetical protein
MGGGCKIVREFPSLVPAAILERDYYDKENKGQKETNR